MFINEKIKKEYKEKLIGYYETYINKDDFIDLSLLKLMAEITSKFGFEVGVFIDRKGRVIDIVVGEKNSLQFESNETVKGLNGVRIIHTHPTKDSRLSDLDKSALINNLYDCICTIGVENNEVYGATVAFINAETETAKLDEVVVANANYINKYGLIEKIYYYDKILLENQDSLHNNNKKRAKAVLVMAEIEKTDDIEVDLKELESLAKTANIDVVGKISQKREQPDARFIIGKGKLEELKNLIQNTNANLVVFDNELSGSKKRNLTDELNVDVIDRSLLILDIFASRAKTSEGKLQVELAQLKYLLPRVGSIIRGHEGSGSGVGLKGPGETKIELNKRIIENNIIKKEKDLANVKKNREIARLGRQKSKKKVVSLVGYTNSGKSTLLNALSGAGVYEKDELFATLDTTTRNVWLNDKNQILLIDTVGFINKLPHELINAFSSTLEESVFADLLLHVVDCSDKNYLKHIEVVKEVLNKIGANSEVIMVYNKVDKVQDLDAVKSTAAKNSVFISAKKLINLDDLKSNIINFINK